MFKKDKSIAWFRVILSACICFALYVIIYQSLPAVYELKLELGAHDATIEQLVANGEKNFDHGVLLKVKAFAEPTGKNGAYELFASKNHSFRDASIRAISEKCIYAENGAEYIGIWRKYPEGNYIEILKFARFSNLKWMRR